MLYAIHGQTTTEASLTPDTLDPFNIPASQIMTSYLNRFYSRTERDSIYADFTSGRKCLPRLNEALMLHIFSFLDFTPIPFHVQEARIAKKYHLRCSQPALWHYIHTIPEILTIMDLMSTYATDFHIEHDQQRRTRRIYRQSQVVLRQTFQDLINASRRYHNADTPVVRPHQFQVPLNDTHQEIIE